jgi:chaperonin GroES
MPLIPQLFPAFLFIFMQNKISNMPFEIGEYNIDKLILVGDRVLIKPKSPNEKTKTGLFLPPGIQEHEPIQSGYVMKVGPGYPIPAINEADEPWKDKSNEVKYVPLQPKEGDVAVFLQKSGWEIEFNQEKFVIIPQSAILLLIRDEGLFT